MAVVTSSVPEHCRTALTHLDLMKYFEGVTLAHDLGLEKKDPALWRAAAEHYGVAPEDCTVFDDSLSACKGARAAKMRVVGVYDGFFAQDEAAMRLGGHTPSGIYRGGKYSLYEAGTRIPFIVRWPSCVKPGEQSAVFSQIDVYRSLAALTGVALPEGAAPDSRNHLPELLGICLLYTSDAADD